MRADHPAIFCNKDRMGAKIFPIHPAMGLMHRPVPRQVTRNHRRLMAQCIDVACQHETETIAGLTQYPVRPNIAFRSTRRRAQKVEVLWRPLGRHMNHRRANPANTAHKRVDHSLD